MSKNKPAVPKGKACGLNKTQEYEDGKLARQNNMLTKDNPYDFFDDYEKHYAWDIGWQEGKE